MQCPNCYHWDTVQLLDNNGWLKCSHCKIRFTTSADECCLCAGQLGYFNSPYKKCDKCFPGVWQKNKCPRCLVASRQGVGLKGIQWWWCEQCKVSFTHRQPRWGQRPIYPVYCSNGCGSVGFACNAIL